VHLDAAFERGINAFDTARIYHGSESVLGEWMAAHGLREQIFIITKGGFPQRARHRASYDEVQWDLDRSLQELRTDYVDLFFLHYDALEVPPEDLVELLEAVRDSGRARAVGVSNIALKRIQECDAASASLGAPRLSAISVQFSLPVPQVPMWPWPGSISIAGDAGRPARAWYATHGISVFAYSSLARGFFSDAFWRGLCEPTPTVSRPRAGLHGDVPWLKAVFHSPDNLERYRRAQQLAQRRNVTPAQVGIAYIAHARFNVYVIAGWSDIPRCEENIAAFDLKLSPEEIAWLELATCQTPSPRS